MYRTVSFTVRYDPADLGSNNTTPEELCKLGQCYRTLGAKEVQFLTINKNPADSQLISVTRERLEAIRLMYKNANK
ncbi:hypothetical protein ACFL7M_19220 [Thermodesulfobacteriota bacterium]